MSTTRRLKSGACEDPFLLDCLCYRGLGSQLYLSATALGGSHPHGTFDPNLEPQTLPTLEVAQANKRLRVTRSIVAFLTSNVNTKKKGAGFPPQSKEWGFQPED